jgi:hypothetical protein
MTGWGVVFHESIVEADRGDGTSCGPNHRKPPA